MWKWKKCDDSINLNERGKSHPIERWMQWLNKQQKGSNVATLALGLQTRQGLAKVWAKSEARESHFIFPGVYQSVKEWTPRLPSELSLWELESQWTPKFSKGNCRGQNSLYWRLLYTIQNLLQPRCLKWACMTHLST